MTKVTGELFMQFPYAREVATSLHFKRKESQEKMNIENKIIFENEN